MRKSLITTVVLALCAGGYWMTLPHFPPLVGVTRLQLGGPNGTLREITQADTLARVVSVVEQQYPRWRSTLAPSGGGPLRLTLYRGDEPIRVVQFGSGTIVSCAMDACVAKRVSVRVPRHLVEVRPSTPPPNGRWN